ncbi:hypothetical protein [Corynebacterium sp. Marseille-P3884]|uniref:hypothetical protein n=1 Tax=Corynebacterium sp. Marseille-P3884 TaxID=2495409 RepID=UPI001B329820|nr:hypothetical protein [Corynebacterium sp. Marseille-P3884]MBP3948407.1 hypothetical protein [Corynebacterium sp. Marseille-P3884]
MAHISLKKKVMAATIAMTMGLGATTVVAPDAGAQTLQLLQSKSPEVRAAYEPLPDDVKQQTEEALLARNNEENRGVNLLGSGKGPGWCIDFAIPSPSNNPADYELRKLTGQSGNYGDSISINEDIETAAIHVAKMMVKEYNLPATERNSGKIQKLNYVLQALLTNNLSALNQVRADIKEGKYVGTADFREITGFDINYVRVAPKDRRNGLADYRLVKNDAAFSKVAQDVSDAEYVTVLLPKDYTLNPNKMDNFTTQRLLTVEQPGLNLEPKPSETPTPQQSTTQEQPAPAPKPTPEQSTEQTTSESTTTETTTEKSSEPSTSNETTSKETTTSKSSEPTSAKETTSTATTTRTEVSRVTEVNRVTEVVKEYHHHYTYIYNYNEYESTIDVSSNVSGSWKFEVKEGGDLAEVVKENGKLVIKPKPGAKGTVTIVVTDAKGTTHEYTVDVDYTDINKNDSNHNVVVNGGGSNNRSVTITLPSDGSHKVVRGGEWASVKEENGKLIVTPKPGSNGKTVVVEILDGNGNTVDTVNVNITVNTKTETHVENIVAGGKIRIENKGSFEFTKGKDLVNVEEKNGELIITPKPNTKGQTVLVVTDEWGNKDQYTINVDTKVNVDERTITLQDGGKSEITISGDWTHRVVSGDDNVKVTKNGNTLVVEGVPGKNGQAVIEILDENNQVIGRYTFVVTTTKQKVTTNVVRKSIDDLTDFSITPGASSNTLKIVQGGNLVTTDENNGKLLVKPKQGSKGTVVVEERTSDNQLLTKWEITITPADIPEERREITDNGSITITGENLTVTKGEKLVNVTKDGDKTLFKPKAGANGEFVIEVRDEEGRTTHRLIVTVKPTQPKTTDINVKLENTSSSSATITVDQNSKHTVIEGEKKVEVTREGGQLIIKPKNGETGKAVIEVKNPDGSTTNYKVDITEGKVPQRNVTIVNTSGDSSNGRVQSGELTVDVKPGNDVKVVEGDKDLVVIDKQDDKVVVRPNEDKPGQSGKLIIEERDPNGNPVKRYEIVIEGKTPSNNDGDQSGTITVTDKDPNKGTLTIETPGKGGEITIKDGNGKDVTGEYTVKDNGDGTYTIIRKDGKPLNGKLDITWTSEDGKNTSSTGTIVIEGNGDKGGNAGTITVTDKDPENGIVEITAPGKGGEITIKDGDKDVTGEFDVKDNGDGTWTLTRKDGKPLSGNLTISWTSPDGKTFTNNVNITVNTGSSKVRGGGSSNPACIGAISLLSLPLLLAIPAGILSQVQVPGFEHVSAQLNAAIQRANTDLQKGLGIFNEDRAANAAGIDAAASQIAPLIGAGAAAVAAIAVIAGIGAGVLHACEVVDLNEASSNGSSSNSNGGSSSKEAASSREQ